jgi:hypothetical protein
MCQSLDPLGKVTSLMTLGPLVLWVFFSLKLLGYQRTLNGLSWLRRRQWLIAPPEMPLTIGLGQSYHLCVRYFRIQQCLVHALVAQHYLSTAYPKLQLYLGTIEHMKGPPQDQPQFHAWLEHEGKVVLGQRDGYLRPLCSWESP